MGVKVTLVESRDSFLGSIDPEIVAALKTHFEKSGISIRVGTQFQGLEPSVSVEGRPIAKVALESASGRSTEAFDAVLYCLGRSGNHEELNLPVVGLKAEERGTIVVDKNYCTKVPNIYAVGDIIGAPALAASSSEQGRLAALHAFTGKSVEFPDAFPYGIYTIPEISSVGVQESQLANRKIPYVVGKANYSKLARGKMINDETGFLKLVVHAKTHRVVGVHVIGTSATELVHIGQVAMSFGAGVEFFVENVFNYPTLAEAYKVAAHNAINKLNGVSRPSKKR
jgi:NAD(P) transhydrogenase